MDPATQFYTEDMARRSGRQNLGQPPRYLAENYEMGFVNGTGFAINPVVVQPQAPMQLSASFIQPPGGPPGFVYTGFGIPNQNFGNSTHGTQNPSFIESQGQHQINYISARAPSIIEEENQRPSSRRSSNYEQQTSEDARNALARRQQFRDEAISLLRRSLEDEEETEAEIRRQNDYRPASREFQEPSQQQWEVRSNTIDFTANQTNQPLNVRAQAFQPPGQAPNYENESLPVNDHRRNFSRPQFNSNVTPRAEYRDERSLRDQDPSLPKFSGDPADWLEFRAAVEEAREFHTERGIRAAIKKHLEGGPLQVARSSFMCSTSIDRVMHELEESYGRPDFIVRAVRQRLRLIAIPEATSRNAHEQLSALVAFEQAVRTLTASMTLIPGYSLNNPDLMSELAAKLPITMRLAWGQVANAQGAPNLEDFRRWLGSYASAARTVATEPFGAPVPIQRARFHYHREEDQQEEQDESKPACALCNSSRHRIAGCPEFKAMSPKKRREAAQTARLCYACLEDSHFQSDCPNALPCATQNCEYKHHKLLCSRIRSNQSPGKRRRSPRRQPELAESESEINQRPIQSPGPVTNQAFMHRRGSNDTLLKILPVTLYGPAGKSVDTYAMLDDACVVSLLDQELADKLELSGIPDPLNLAWTGDITRSENLSQAVHLKISARNGQKQFCLPDVRTVANLSMQPQSIDAAKLKQEFPHLSPADLPDMDQARPRLVIGVDQAKLCFPLNFLEGSWRDPIAVQTRLGWVVYGHRDRPIQVAKRSP